MIEMTKILYIMLAFIFGFKVKLLDLVSVDHHNAGLFRVGGIDKHFLWHESPLHARLSRAPGGAKLRRVCLVKAILDTRQS